RENLAQRVERISRRVPLGVGLADAIVGGVVGERNGAVATARIALHEQVAVEIVNETADRSGRVGGANDIPLFVIIVDRHEAESVGDVIAAMLQIVPVGHGLA